MKTRVLSWWSGGVPSAIASGLALRIFKDVRVVFIDTKNEDKDTYRFMEDCEKLYGVQIERISNPEYKSIEDVWLKYKSLNTAHGAICSTELKREMREQYQNLDTDYAQVFGFDINERKRHLNMRKNYPELNVISLLIDLGYSKADCFRELKKFGIEPPRMYKMGFRNNNCFETMCVKGGIGYWQKVARELPDKFDRMAVREHQLTNLKGEPVTMLKDRTDGKVARLFLKPHPDYPHIKDISMVTGREPEPLIECNGFCSTKD